MRVLAVGDVVAQSGVDFVRANLAALKREKDIDFCIVNGENASNMGISCRQADTLFDAGADVITLGNHAWRKEEIFPYMERNRRILRPANYPRRCGRGWGVYDTPFGQVAVVVLAGRCSMEYTPENPFLEVERILKQIKTKLVFVEIHAEATSEKLAMGRILDGKVSAVFGTHTHVPTADEQIFPRGTGYQTDLGMTGPKNGILGMDVATSCRRFLGEHQPRYAAANGACKLEGCIFTIDTESGLCTAVERVYLHD